MSRGILPRLELLILKQKSASDPARVKATNAVVHLYRQGEAAPLGMAAATFHLAGVTRQ